MSDPLPRDVLGTVVKLIVASLLVGVALSFFGISPLGLIESFGSTVRAIYEMVLNFAQWAVKYVLIGAVVVIPIWLVFFLLRLMRGRR